MGINSSFITEDGKIGALCDGESKIIDNIESSSTSSIVCYDKYAFFVSKENTLLCIDMTNLNSHEVKCYSESGKRVEGCMYNVKVYNGEKLLLYISENDDYNWILCDYSIGVPESDIL